MAYTPAIFIKAAEVDSPRMNTCFLPNSFFFK